MPTYVFRCNNCWGVSEERIPITAFDASLTYPCGCGGTLKHQFSPNNNIVIPRHMKQGTYDPPTWSDIHGDVTEKELARMPGVERYDYAQSQSFFGSRAEREKRYKRGRSRRNDRGEDPDSGRAGHEDGQAV